MSLFSKFFVLLVLVLGVTPVAQSQAPEPVTVTAWSYAKFSATVRKTPEGEIVEQPGKPMAGDNANNTSIQGWFGYNLAERVPVGAQIIKATLRLTQEIGSINPVRGEPYGGNFANSGLRIETGLYSADGKRQWNAYGLQGAPPLYSIQAFKSLRPNVIAKLDVTPIVNYRLSHNSSRVHFVARFYQATDDDDTADSITLKPGELVITYLSPDPNPGTGKIVFENAVNYKFDIGLARPNGSNSTFIKLPDTGEFQPTISPDGKTIAYIQTPNYLYPPSTGELWLMNRDGSNRRKLVDSASHPSWHPDGKSLIYSVGVGFGSINADGTDERLILPEYSDLVGGWKANPHYNCDGTLLTFGVHRTDGRDIFVANSDGTNVRLAANLDNHLALFPSGNGDADADQPSFDANGDLIFRAYPAVPSTTGSGDNGPDKAVIFRAKAGSWNQTRTPEDFSALIQLTEFGAYEWPAPSPDGRKIAFSRFSRGDYNYEFGVSTGTEGPFHDIFVMDSDGSNERRITFGAKGEKPNWGPPTCASAGI